MAVDPEYLRQHYASLSDAALLAMDPAELVDMARNCYDHELIRRGLHSRPGVRPEARPEARPETRPVVHHPQEGWQQDAAEVYSQVHSHRRPPGPEVANARDALEAAGIPCYVDESVIAEYTYTYPEQHQWRVMVPGKLNMQAASILDRDVFNADFEANWKAHLETLSEKEVLAMDPQEVFCGLFDRIERVTRAYREEIARRRRIP